MPWIRAMCFDLDGVLIRSMRLHAVAWQRAAQAFELTVSREEIYLWEGEPGTVTARRLLTRQHKTASSQAIHALLAAKEQAFQQLASQVTLVRPLIRWLPQLKATGRPLALVTGTSHTELRSILPQRVLRLFTVVVTGDRVRHGKPHPEPYHTAFRHLRVPPAQNLVIENAPYGIQSAQRAKAGMVIALTSSLPAAQLQDADAIIHSPEELMDLVSVLLSSSH